MGKKTISSVNDCRDSRNIDKFAAENGLRTREAAGSHKMVYVKNEQGGEDAMTYYNSKDISIGVAAKIFKFFRRYGLVVIIWGTIAYMLFVYLPGIS